MGYYVPNKVKPVCYNCPYRTNKYCGLLTEHDYLGDYPFNFEPYPYCPLIEVADRKTENCSEKPNNCEYAENPSGDVWECGCFLDTYCEHQIYDRNPDGTINIVECGYEPKDEPQTDNGIGCSRCESRYDCYDRDMPHAVRCNNYGKITDEPQTERSE